MIASGTVEERLNKIIEAFSLPTVVSVDDAVAHAKERVAEATRILEEDDRFHDARRKKSLGQKIRYAVRY